MTKNQKSNATATAGKESKGKQSETVSKDKKKARVEKSRTEDGSFHPNYDLPRPTGFCAQKDGDYPVQITLCRRTSLQSYRYSGENHTPMCGMRLRSTRHV
jgi:hypothetical protein